jgi:hypothetical protein
MENNLYLNVLKKSNPKKIELKKHKNKIIPRTIEIKKSPRREIIQQQNSKCFLCGKHFANSITNFAVIEGPDPKTKEITRQLRALCQECYFKSKR